MSHHFYIHIKLIRGGINLNPLNEVKVLVGGPKIEIRFVIIFIEVFWS